MTARLNDRDLSRLLDDWLDEGPMTAADSTIDRVMARVPTVRQRARVRDWRPALPRLLRTQAPMLASLAVVALLLAGLALAVGIITRPGPAPSPPPPPSSEATASPSPSVSAEASPKRAASEAVVEQIRGPVPLRTFDVWVAKSRDPSLGGEPGARLPGYTGYTFTPDSTGRWLVIHLDPTRDYGQGGITRGGSLTVEIGWNFYNLLDPDLRGQGRFVSELGECELTFTTFTEKEIAGVVDCVDVPGTYSVGPGTGIQEGVIERVRAAFSLDPVADADVP